jgi:hypothetical protein
MAGRLAVPSVDPESITTPGRHPMNTTQYLLNAGLLAFVLWANLGTRTVSRVRFTLPLLLVAVAAAVFLRNVPTMGHDIELELVGVGAGAVLGLIAAALVRVERDGRGRLVMRAGIAYAALWIAVIGGRCVFAYGADHWFGRAIGEFSMTHQITGADAWTAAFILMALSMVVVRVAATGVLTARAARRPVAVLA